jgi:hypothetical protein
MLATQCVTMCVTMWSPQTGRVRTVSDSSRQGEPFSRLPSPADTEEAIGSNPVSPTACLASQASLYVSIQSWVQMAATVTSVEVWAGRRSAPDVNQLCRTWDEALVMRVF